MKPSQVKTVLNACISNRLPVLLVGAPGVGKTDMVVRASQDAGADLLTVYCATSDPTDPRGVPATWATADGQVADFIPTGWLKQLIHADRPLVCFLDDVGAATPAVQLSMMNLVLARKTGDGTPISDHVVFIAATNRRQDKAGVTGMLEPFKSRWATIIHFESDLEDWVDWALQANMPTELISFVRFRPDLLHDFTPSADLVNTPCPRTVANVGKLMMAGLPREVEYDVYSGAAGEGFAAELLGFLDICRELPSPDAILMDPANADVPEKPATLYAMCGALAAKASQQTIERLVCYANRLPDEFSVLLMRDVLKKDKTVVNTRPYIEWGSKHKDVLL